MGGKAPTWQQGAVWGCYCPAQLQKRGLAQRWEILVSEKASWRDEGPVGFGEFIVLMAAALQDCMCSVCPALSCSIDHRFDSCWFIYLLDNNLLNKALLEWLQSPKTFWFPISFPAPKSLEFLCSLGGMAWGSLCMNQGYMSWPMADSSTGTSRWSWWDDASSSAINL